MNVGRNDQVTLTSSDGKYKIKTRIQILPGVRPGTVTIARGFGYRQAGAAAQIIDAASTVDRTRGAGINPYLFESGIVKISKA
jgi:anaerobic selenocysteine-containing dehydrogenase